MDANELINQLKEKYPLFQYKIDNYGIRVQLDRSGSTWVKELNPNVIQTLDDYHKKLEVQTALETKYPYLCFYVGNDYKPHAIWVMREGRSGEAIHYIIQDDPPYMQDIMLQHYNLEAKKALQPDWFFCTNCGEAKPRSEYAYFYFAGEYCKKCKDEDPEHYKMAQNESYN